MAKQLRLGDPPIKEGQVAKVAASGTGVYRITKRDAGEIHKAAKAYKMNDVSYWRRRRGKGNK
jgi:hypothetical protein